MRFSRTFVLVLLLAEALAVFSARAGDDTLKRAVDAVFSGLVGPQEPGLAVLVRTNGRTVYARGFGVAELRSRTRIDDTTNFRLASVTKQFTAMAIMLLVHDGRLRYDDPLTSIFPAFPDYGRAITIRHLLTHTSGLPDYEELMEQAEKANGPRWSAARQIQDDEVLALLAAQTKGDFAPGTRWAYSNSGYVVLGLVVAKGAGMPYREFVARRIFAPLGMTRTVVYQRGINEVTRRAFGHRRETDGFLEADQSSTSATLGDGGIYSNLVDLAKWDAALETHRLLAEADMRAGLTPVRLNDGTEPIKPAEANQPAEPRRPVSYGFGWYLDPYKGHARSYHDGDTTGFRTTIQRFSGDRSTVVVLCNRTDIEPDALSLEVADALFAAAGR